MRRQLPVILIMLLLSSCGVLENLPAETPTLPLLDETVTLPTPEEIEVEEPDPEPLPTTLEAIPLLTIESPQVTPPVPPSSPSELLDTLIEQARQDLAQRLSISVDQIELIEASEVVWRDSSLGCPQKGMAYLQVLTPGYLILLEAGGKEYEYHAGLGTEPIYCENPSPPSSGGLKE